MNTQLTHWMAEVNLNVFYRIGLTGSPACSSVASTGLFLAGFIFNCSSKKSAAPADP